MGLVLLDITFRAQKAFQVQIPENWVERLGIHAAGDDATLEQYHQCLLDLCREQQVEPPQDSWEVLIQLVSDASGEDPQDLLPSTWLIKDIAPDG